MQYLKEKQTAIYPPSDVQHQYNILECASNSSPSPLSKISRIEKILKTIAVIITFEAPKNTTSADYKTIVNSSRASKRNKGCLPHSEPPAVKHRQVGSCRCVLANNHDTNTSTVSNYSDEYAVPIDIVTKVTA